MKDDLGLYPRVQAKSTLDQLVFKGLAEKMNIKISTPEQGKCLSTALYKKHLFYRFYPYVKKVKVTKRIF